MHTLLRSILSILAGKSFSILIKLIFTPILVRVISQEQYGLYASILAAFSLITLLSKGGLFDACRKTVAEATSDSAEIQKVISLSLVFSLLYGAIGTALVSVLLFSGILPQIYRPYVLVLLVSIIFTNVFSVIRGVFFGIQRELWGEFLGVSRQLVYVITGLILAYVGHGLSGVFAGYTLSFIIITFISSALIMREFSFQLPTSDDFRTQGKHIATYGGYQLIGGMSAAFLYKADILLVELFQGASSTALYNSAIVPAEMIWFIPSVIQLSFLQHTANLWSEGEIEKINETVKTGIKYGTLSLALFGVGLFGLAEPLLSVYFGQEYVGAATTLQVLILGTFFFGLSRVTMPVFQAIGWIRATEFATLIALIINIALNVVLIPRYGIFGAGIGTMISYTSIFVGNIVIWNRSSIDIVPIEWFAKLIAAQAIFAAIFLGTVFVCDSSPIVSLLIFPPFGLLVFLGTNVFAGYIRLSDLKAVFMDLVE
ncbi:flippase [Haloarcula halophila]|uniref:flippase n=1 Tax=Haloarcula TaxID=2237 RepID=UPI0023E3DADF|nr:flippase [Halomicroarcula sp. DFY41]